MENFGIQNENNKRRMQIARSFRSDEVINLQKALDDYLEKGKPANEGEQREWNGKKYKKVSGKWIPVTEGREKKEQPESGDKKQSTKSSGSSVDNHEIAQMTHMKKIMDENPDKAYEIYQSLSPESQQKVPQEVVNKLVENSHSEKEDPASKVFDSNNKTFSNGITKEQLKTIVKNAKQDAADWTNFQQGKITSKKAIENIVNRAKEQGGQNVVFLQKWLEDQVNNKLPDSSSGSTISALLDIDNIVMGSGLSEDDEKGYEYLSKLLKQK